MSDGEGSCPQPVKKTRLSLAKAEEAAFQTEGSGDENVRNIYVANYLQLVDYKVQKNQGSFS